MRSILLALATTALIVAGCDSQPDDAPPPQHDAPLAGGDTSSAQEGFVLLRGADTLAVERFSRDGNTLDGELIDAESGDRLTYRATLDDDDRITRIEIAFFPSGSSGAEQRAVGEFRGDTLVSETRRGDGEPEVQRLVTPAGTSLVIANSTATLEPLVRRFRAAGGAEAQFPVLMVGGDGDEPNRPQQARLSRLPGDSVQLSLGAESMARAAVDGDGNIQGAATADAQVRVVRTRR